VVPWRAYLSTNAVYDDGVDTLIDSGVIPSPGLIKLTPTPETFDGTWPEGADTWYLVVVLDAGDDQTPGNDWGASGPVSTVDPDVNYDVLTVATTGAPPLAGGPLTGEFTVENIGTADGRHAVGWTAYRSDDATLTIGVDPVIASGSTVELTASDSVTIPFSNTWPASLTMKTYYLFVRVIVADDILATDNTGMSVMVVVNPPNVDYDVVSITNTGALVAGGALSGSLEIRNIGTVNGSRTVNWYVYRSLDLVFVEGTDPVIASGSIPGGLPFATSAYPTFNGTWPEDTVAHTYYYYVKLITADDIAAGNDDQFSAGNVVNPPAAFPDYRVEAPVVQPEGAPSTLLSASGPHSFQIREAAGTAGTKPINWKVYASRDTTLDGTDTLLGSGSTGFLGANGLSVSIPFDGTWPAFPTYYRLLVNVDADDDANPANDTWVSPMIEVPLAYNETGIDNDDSGPTPPAFSNYSNTGATLGVDQLVRINGTMDLAGGYDTYRITAGVGQTTIEISLFLTSGFDDCDLYLWNDSGGEVTSLDISADMEPDSPPLTIINLIPGNYYFIGVYFYRDGGSRVTPDPYRLYLYGQP
jgi:hypothetical protein